MQHWIVLRLGFFLSLAFLTAGFAAFGAQPDPPGGESEKWELEDWLPSLSQSVLTVCASGCDHTTIQAAIDAADSGDWIQILEQVITEAGISVDKNLIFQGLGAAQTIVQAHASPVTATDRVFDIAQGLEVTIADMTIRHGNPVAEGGGIRNAFSTLNIINSRISTNQAKEGGGIATYGGEVNIYSSTIDNNKADLGNGGGIYESDGSGKVLIVDSTLSGNISVGDGGAIAARTSVSSTGPKVDLLNSTIADNVADSDSNNIGDGGGIAARESMAVNLRNTIIGQNVDFGGEVADCLAEDLTTGGFNSLGHNLIGDTAGCSFAGASGDLLNVFPMLSELRYNGGDTPTMAISWRSPAAGNGDLANCYNTDQRDVDRPGDGDCDIGAFEQYGVSICSSPNVEIPDNDPGGVDLLLKLPTARAQEILDLDVSVDIEHSYVEDLSITLVNDTDGDSVKLLDNVIGCYESDIDATFDDQASEPVLSCGNPVAIDGFFQPDEPLQEMTGSYSNRHWRLNVADGADEDVGTVKEWCLYAEIRPEITPSQTADRLPARCLPGDCSLRDALLAANGSPGLDLITLGSQKYDLSVAGRQENLGRTGDLDVTDLLNLSGAGREATIIDGGGIDRVFDIFGENGIVIFSDLTVEGGDSGSEWGAGIWSWDGAVVLNDVNVRENKSADLGGGIGTGPDAWMQLNNTDVYDNEAAAAAGILNSGSMFFQLGTIHHNEATSYGGGIYNTAILEVNNSTINNNVADDGAGTGSGGGIAGAFDSQITLNNTTLSNNLAGGVSDNGGGGLMLYGGMASLNHVTLADNASAAGGGVVSIRPLTDDVTLRLQGTIVDGSTPNCAIIPESGMAANIISDGYNIGLDDSCQLNGPQDQPNTNPLLGPMADNGGPTQTVGLLPGSPALDAGNETVCGDLPSLEFDQRGRSRPVDGDGDGAAVCDIGAFEAEIAFIFLPMMTVMGN